MNVTTNLNFNQNEIQNSVIGVLNSAPTNPKKGQVYCEEESGLIFGFDGSSWKPMNGTSEGGSGGGAEFYSDWGRLASAGLNVTPPSGFGDKYIKYKDKRGNPTTIVAFNNNMNPDYMLVFGFSPSTNNPVLAIYDNMIADFPRNIDYNISFDEGKNWYYYLSYYNSSDAELASDDLDYSIISSNMNIYDASIISDGKEILLRPKDEEGIYSEGNLLEVNMVRGDGSTLNSYMGVEGQIVYDRTAKGLRVMDGETRGGHVVGGSTGGGGEVDLSGIPTMSPGVSTISIWHGTQAQYDALSKDPNTLYIIV